MAFEETRDLFYTFPPEKIKNKNGFGYNQIKYYPTVFLNVCACVCVDCTSSGSISLNSMPRPVQAMKCELDGSSSSATRNCQSCSEPLRW